MPGRTAVVAMSGGVDSSVAAALLREQGYRVIGLFMRVGAAPPPSPSSADGRPRQGCCSADDAADARLAAGTLGIAFYSLDFKEDFESLIDYFVDEYCAGHTPNPCVLCNSRLKFGRLLEYADAVGADFLATGHHARIHSPDGHPRLQRATDRRKDQSYVLFGIPRRVLPRMLLPIGHLTKDAVRREATRLGLPVCDKPDSVEICFVPDRRYARLVRQRRPEAFRPGAVLDQDGQVLGQHDGIPGFTIGQRRGLGIAAGHPVYVTRLNVLDNTVTVGPREALLCRRFRATGLNLHDEGLPARFRADVQIRYQHTAAPAEVVLAGDGSAVIAFDQPQAAVTPGQAAVFYRADLVLGGGWIDRILDDHGNPG